MNKTMEKAKYVRPTLSIEWFDSETVMIGTTGGDTGSSDKARSANSAWEEETEDYD